MIFIIAQIVLAVVLAFTSYNSKHKFIKIIFFISLLGAMVMIFVTGINNINTNKELSNLRERNNVSSLIDRAIADGDREAYLHLKHIANNFDSNRKAAINGVSQVEKHILSTTHLKNFKLPKDENSYTTKELINILFFNSHYLYRARSAQLLADKKEQLIIQALLISIFSDLNLEVVKEARKAFCKITSCENEYLLDPYYALSFWKHNLGDIKNRIMQSNDFNMVPWKMLETKLKDKLLSNEYNYMVYWWITTLDIMYNFIFDKVTSCKTQ